MNKTKARWQLYRLLKQDGLIDSLSDRDIYLRPRRGGYSYEVLENWINNYFDIELGIFPNPVKYLKEWLL